MATLGGRPAALDHSRVYRDWRLPAEFGTLRRRLEERHGPSAGARQYIRVLQLLAQHPISRVQQAIRQCPSPEALHADRIIQHTFRLAKGDVGDGALLEGVDHDDLVRAVQVRIPDLSQFDRLLSQGERAHVWPTDASAQDQPPAASADPDLVYMTTRLDGTKTFFLPFNLGDGTGAGNPDNPNGYKTAYLREQVWQRDSWLDILARFIHLSVEEKTLAGKTKRTETMIFPRYHQLVAVRMLEADTR